MQQFCFPPELEKKIINLRRQLHQYPELSFNEAQTAKTIAKHLDELHIEYKMNIGGHGIVATIPGRIDGPYIALRADMDALPIQEETSLPFKSKHNGVMHACGHDGHSAILLGAAEILKNSSLPPLLPVKLIWQPAEEKGSGALQMIAAGCLDNVAMIFGGHLDRHYTYGQLAISEGPVNASADMFQIKIKGASGHGARPHEACDAIVVASLLVMALQTIVSREVDPAIPSVVTVGKLVAGDAANVIAGHAYLEGTIRCCSKEVREHLVNSLQRMCSAISQLHNAQINLEISPASPPLINLPDITELAKQAAEKVVKSEDIVGLRTANMGGEDFAYFLDHVPGCYIRFGAQKEGHESYPAHSSHFDFDERGLKMAALWFAHVTQIAAQSILEQKIKRGEEVHKHGKGNSPFR